jgi:hypothetical protein
MGTWGTAIKDNDSFADIYDEFFDLYDKGGQSDIISKKIIDGNWEILDIEEEKNSLWFALALAQWETKSLDPEVFATVENIVSSETDVKIWVNSGASEQDIKKRKIALDNFLKKIQSDRPSKKPRKRTKSKLPIFATGDCLVFKLKNGNYGGAVVLATDNNPETAYNLVATTRLNQIAKPTIENFEKAEVLICNFGQWQEKQDVIWHFPDLYHRNCSEIYEVAGKLSVEIEYDTKNYDGKGYLFKPSYTAGWSMNEIAERQFESEITKTKPTKTLTIKQLTKKRKWWKVVKKNRL